MKNILHHLAELQGFEVLEEMELVNIVVVWRTGGLVKEHIVVEVQVLVLVHILHTEVQVVVLDDIEELVLLVGEIHVRSVKIKVCIYRIFAKSF